MRKFMLLIAVLLFSSLNFTPIQAQSPGAAVHAVLFYSPTCPHCHKVITETLSPMLEQYGSQLLILGVDVTQEAGGKLYDAAVKYYDIPQNRQGVPTLIVGDTILVGDQEIPAEFPGIVEKGLADGGIDWPSLPDLVIPPTATPAPADSGSEQTTATPTAITAAASNLTADTQIPDRTAEATGEDPIGIAIAWGLMVVMLLALGYAAWRLAMHWQDVSDLMAQTVSANQAIKHWAIPLLAILGIGVAAYLSYIEITSATAVCGPIGHCNEVQASPYAKILGIPVAVLGLINYAALIVLWFGVRAKNVTIAGWSAVLILAMTVFGVLFSIYLTYVELYLINAVCAWCMTSALITTILMLIALAGTTGLPYDDDTPSETTV